MEQPAISAEFKRESEVEITPNELRSSDDLRKYLEDNGIWQQENVEKSGNILKWDDFMCEELYQQYKGNERKFFLSTYRNDQGQTKTRFETAIKAVWADIDYDNPSGDTLRMVQDSGRWTHIVSGGIIRAGMRSDVERKRGSSISGKMRPDEVDEPMKTLRRKIAEELGLKEPDYTVTNQSRIPDKESYSFGFPGLWTRQEQIMKYDIKLNNNFKEQYEHVGKAVKIGNTVRTPVTIFKWQKV